MGLCPYLGDGKLKEIMTKFKNQFENQARFVSDLEKSLAIYWFMRLKGEKNEALMYYAKNRFKGHYKLIKKFSEFVKTKWQNIKSLIEDEEKLKYRSIKLEEPIDDVHLVKTHKELFCRRCYVFDCLNHGILTSADFQNLEDLSPKLIESKASLNNHHRLMSQSSYWRSRKEFDLTQTIPEYLPAVTEACSNCYLKINSYKEFQSLEIKWKKSLEKQESPIFNEVQIAFVKLGLKTFAYSPCKITLLAKDHVKCFDVFFFLLLVVKNEENPKSLNVPFTRPMIKSKTRSKAKKPFVKKIPLLIQEKIKNNIKRNYGPCYHKEDSRESADGRDEHCKGPNCHCAIAGLCQKYCHCDPKKCKIRRVGCECKGNCLYLKCTCFSIDSECDPDLCKGCFNTCSSSKKNDCVNNSIFFKQQRRTAVAKSKLCDGYGLFCLEFLKKGEFILEYKGELLENDDAEYREVWNEVDEMVYSFSLTDQITIDAKYKGNKARFINHSKDDPNCFPKTIFSDGDYHVGIYANKDIVPGTELTFDYDGTDEMWKKFDWILKRHNNSNISKEKSKKKLKKNPEEVSNSVICEIILVPRLAVNFASRKGKKLKVIKLKSDKNNLILVSESDSFDASD